MRNEMLVYTVAFVSVYVKVRVLNCSLDLCIHLTGYAMTLLLGLKKLIVGLFFIVTRLCVYYFYLI